MVQCTNGTQVKAGAPVWAWLLWSGFLAWLTTHFSRFGNIVWIFFPDQPINIAEFCSAEIGIPSPPALLTWVKAFTYDPNSRIEVGDYLIALYKAAVWDTYCECAPFTGAGADPYTAAVLADSPSAYYLLDETTGTTPADSSGNGRTGAYGNTSGATSNSQLHQPGPFSGWYSVGNITGLCGETPTVNVADPTTSAVGTFEGWFFDSNPSVAVQNIFDYVQSGAVQGNGLWFSRTTTGQFSMPFWGGSFHDNVASGLPASTWHYIAMSYDGTDARLYYDGALLVTVTAAIATPITAGARIYFGGTFAGGFCGRMSRLAYYGAALSATRIAAHYAAAGGVPFQPPYTPPAPVDPTAIPDHPDPTCTTTADLCTAIARLQAIDMTTQREMNWLQSSQSPTGWSPGTTATGLTGAGTIAATDIVGVFVDISIPSRWGRTAETPYRSIPEVGSIGYAIDGVQSGRYGLHYAQEQIFGAPAATTAIVYNLRPGVSASITPLQRLK